MHFEQLEIPGVFLMTPTKFGDTRGYFMETFRQELFDQHVGGFEFVQDNQSLSAEVGTVRGLHFQVEPKAQGKLVRCIAGALFDVAVDIRTDSHTYGRHVSVELTAENAKQLWVPPGFAHGFCTLASNTEISYKVTQYYSAEHDHGVLWIDPALGIDWPVSPENAIVSEKDRRQPRLRDLGDGIGKEF